MKSTVNLNNYSNTCKYNAHKNELFCELSKNYVEICNKLKCKVCDKDKCIIAFLRGLTENEMLQNQWITQIPDLYNSNKKAYAVDNLVNILAILNLLCKKCKNHENNHCTCPVSVGAALVQQYLLKSEKCFKSNIYRLSAERPIFRIRKIYSQNAVLGMALIKKQSEYTRRFGL